MARSPVTAVAPSARKSEAEGGPRSAWFEPCVHSAYFHILSGLLAARGLAAPRAYTGAARLMPLLDFLPMLDAIGSPPDARAGVEIGCAVAGAANGPMGLAVMTSATLRDAMRTAARYTPIRNRMFDYGYREDGGRARLVMPERIPLGGYREFLQAATVFAIFNVFRAVVDEEALHQVELWLPWASSASGVLPAPAALYPVRYRAQELAICFPLALAGMRLASADAEMHQRLCRAGDEELTRLSGSVTARVRQLVHQAQPHWQTLARVADMLALSRRTLLRRLKSEGLSYQDLLDEARNELACWYLRHTALTLASVSEKLGFSEQANFSRSFRRWQGLAPSDYRACFASQALQS